MYHLRLCRALSYRGIISATKKKPDVYIDQKTVVEAAVSTGYFKLMGEVKSPGASNNREEALDKKSRKTLDEMTVPELETFATYKGISLKGINKKADIINKLKREMPAAETEGKINYVSQTMIELEP